MSTLSDRIQTIRQPLYHALTIPAVGGALITTYFQNATATARGYGTNLEQDGRLPRPDSFECFSPRIVPAFTAVVTDAQLVVSCFTTITFNQRPFLEVPAWLLPAGAGIWSDQGGIIAAVPGATHGVADPNAVWDFGEQSLEVLEGQSFRQSLDYNAPAGLPVAAVLTHVVWDGLYTRGGQ